MSLKLSFPDKKMEKVFQAFQIEQHLKNFNVCFIISLFSTIYSLAIAIKSERGSYWIGFNILRIAYVFFAFFIGRKFKRLLQYPFLVLELMNTYAVMRFFDESISGHRGFELALKKIILTFSCIYPTYDWILKSIIVFLGCLYINIMLYGFNISWKDDMTWNIYLYVFCLFFYFYNEEKFKRILFKRYYNELENLQRWKFISEKFIPTGFTIASCGPTRNSENSSDKRSALPIKILYFNDFFKNTLNISNAEGVLAFMKNLPIKDWLPMNEEARSISKENTAYTNIEGLLNGILNFKNTDCQRNFGKRSDFELNIGNFSSLLKCKLETGKIEERSYHISLFEFREQEEPCVLIIVKDLSEQRRNENLVELHNYKDLLMASGTTSLLQHKEISDQEIIEGLQQIKTSSDLLLSEINDILDFSQIAKGKLRLNSNEFIVDDVVQQLSRLFEIPMKEKSLTFIKEINLQNSVIVSDLVRLKQILINLLGNALKFTFEGSITIKVKDTGTGMKEDIIKQLFQLYGTFDDSARPINRQGIGLGLLISRQLVGKLGPREMIKVTSMIGKGSEFNFEIYRDLRPFLSHTSEGQEKSTIFVLESKKFKDKVYPVVPLNIISTEKHEANKTQKRKTKKGCKNFWHLSKVPKSIALPELKPKKRTSILLNLENEEKFENTNCLTNNVCTWTERIFEENNVLNNVNSSSPKKFLPSKAPASKANQIRFLIVDDSPFNLLIIEKFLKNIFSKKEIVCFKAYDGLHAIELVEQGREKGQFFDLIFMDCNMMRMDGYEATTLIREKMKAGLIKECPILGVTADSGYQTRNRVFECGMDDYITKPMTQDVFSTSISKWIDLSQLKNDN